MAQGNFTESVSKPLEVAFEASGLSFDDAERFAAAFKPSWEFDEAPFTDGGGVHASQIDGLAAGGVHADIVSPPDSRTVPPRAPPPRVETHEPEVSVIIDRSIVAAEIEAAPRQAQAARPVAVPSFGGPARAQPQRIAPVMSSRADESLGLPASLKKSNKGLFIGLGVAVVAAGLVFAVHGMMTPDASDSAASTSTSTSATAPAPTTAVATPPVPVPAATAAPPPSRPAPAAVAPVVAAPVAAAPNPVPPPAQHSAPAPRPAPHAAAVHHAAPKNPPKPAAGGIVRDAPF